MTEEQASARPLPDGDAIEGKKFFPRAAAYLLDVGVIGLLGFTSSFIVLFTTTLVGLVLGYDVVFPDSAPFLPTLVSGFVLQILFFTLGESLFGATPGKLVLGMRVTTLTGDLPSIRASFVRAIWRFVDGLVFGLVAHSAMQPPLRQRHGDKRAGTLVVASKSPLITSRPSIILFLLSLMAFFALSLLSDMLTLFPFVKITPARPLPLA